MSLSSALTQVETVLEAIPGLARHPDGKATDISRKGHQDLDGAFSMYTTSTNALHQEIFDSPSQYWQRFTVEVVTKIKADSTRLAAEQTAGARANLVIRALVGATLPGADCHAIFQDGEPFLEQLDDKKLIWRATFRLLYTEA